VTAAAKKLGISRRTLHRKINEMNTASSRAGAASMAANEQPASAENGG
jgi:molybdenum-dependent DNA-binding transcriptional regulator ModE